MIHYTINHKTFVNSSIAYKFHARISEKYLLSASYYQLYSDCNQLREHSSVVEHSTADREVLGSNPSAPSEMTNGHF